ncbi:hypothetical protein [Devosia sp. A369]
MRLLATTALLLTATLPAIAAEPQPALNNLSHEFATCAAYFGVITVALENSNDLATAAKYQTLVGQALVYATTTGETIGLLPETTIARFDLAVEERWKSASEETHPTSASYSPITGSRAWQPWTIPKRALITGWRSKPEVEPLTN